MMHAIEEGLSGKILSSSAGLCVPTSKQLCRKHRPLCICRNVVKGNYLLLVCRNAVHVHTLSATKWSVLQVDLNWFLTRRFCRVAVSPQFYVEPSLFPALRSGVAWHFMRWTRAMCRDFVNWLHFSRKVFLCCSYSIPNVARFSIEVPTYN